MKRTIVAALCACAASTAWPQEPEDAVVVTATRFPQARSQTLQPVKIITAEDVARSGQQPMVEVLQTLGGVEVTSNGAVAEGGRGVSRAAKRRHSGRIPGGRRVSESTSASNPLSDIPH